MLFFASALPLPLVAAGLLNDSGLYPCDLVLQDVDEYGEEFDDVAGEEDEDIDIVLADEEY